MRADEERFYESALKMDYESLLSAYLSWPIYCTGNFFLPCHFSGRLKTIPCRGLNYHDR